MKRPPLLALLACVLGVAAALLVACGDSNGLLSSGQARQLKSGLDGVAAAVRNQRCTAIEGAVARVQRRLEALPARVDDQIRTGLERKVADLHTVARDECAAAVSEAETTVETEPTETTDTSTETTTTTETETQPTVTTETATQPTTPTETVPPPTTSPEAPPDGGTTQPPGSSEPPPSGGTPPPDDGGVQAGGTRTREPG